MVAIVQYCKASILVSSQAELTLYPFDNTANVSGSMHVEKSSRCQKVEGREVKRDRKATQSLSESASVLVQVEVVL